MNRKYFLSLLVAVFIFASGCTSLITAPIRYHQYNKKTAEIEAMRQERTAEMEAKKREMHIRHGIKYQTQPTQVDKITESTPPTSDDAPIPTTSFAPTVTPASY